jgi:16S rRNA C967 or C1407 C5-methylase (RsmB/RsmF family)/NOL1/NOP2/fmu family ribosome biogenesis protein
LLGDHWAAFEQALQEESPVSIRLNPFKQTDPETAGSLEKVPWASGACYLPERPVFTLDPLLHAGCYYVQEASSMYLEQIICKHISGKVRALDLCAAPGGKSTHLSSLLPEGSLLVANDVIRSRSRILVENLAKWGNPHTIVTNCDPAVSGRLTGFFDLIVADLPCSGEGMFRKDPASIAGWSVNNVRLCAERQRRIIADVWPALKTGGILIYSTCTYNREENEENRDWICRDLGAETIDGPHRFMPHLTKGEGFFIVALKRLSPNPAPKEKGGAGIPKLCASALPSPLKAGWEEGEFVFFSENNVFHAIPSVHRDDYFFLRKRLKMIAAGITLGEMKGRDFIPSAALALSCRLPANAFQVWEADRNTALKYLRKEALQELPEVLPKGYILVTYRGFRLGFIKNIGNRANNLYPQEWRIRMA